MISSRSMPSSFDSSSGGRWLAMSLLPTFEQRKSPPRSVRHGLAPLLPGRECGHHRTRSLCTTKVITLEEYSHSQTVAKPVPNPFEARISTEHAARLRYFV